MSILIKDKALPKTCEECLFYGVDVENGCFVEKCFVLRRAGQDKPSWCPLVPVPPHGRLIDADELKIDFGFTWDDIAPTREEMFEIIDRQPTAEPQRIKGKWALQSDDYHEYYECDQCGIAVGIDDIRNFCPNCGADMREVTT